jgi:hypothetical protein
MEYERIAESAQIQTGRLPDFFKPVNQSISVHKQFFACGVDIQVVMQENLNGMAILGVGQNFFNFVGFNVT